MPGAMKISLLIIAGCILLAQIFSARGGNQRLVRCQKLDGRCETECLSFEEKIGGCRYDMTPLCCKKRERN
ncbi:PREDICTED: beta-defensin 107A-like [Miniopterus natalensis]|uniref:beta-defensin 107A-like n=1 Tax=Miniopterus natalensis TaxID=291302 RepID=UPI0007A6E3FE|nr:PREDICTED: beta-defensin 107A-like [Miniopterus natalensis]